MTVTITNQGNPVNIAAESQAVSVNVTNYDTSAAAIAAAIEADAARDEAVLYGGLQVSTMADLYALTSGQVAVGGYVVVKSLGAWFKRVASGGDLAHTASVLAWEVQRSAIGFDLRAFGAVGGATNDLASLNAAIARLNTITGAEALHIVGEYTITGTPKRITKSSKSFICYGGQINHDAGTLFTFGDGVSGSKDGGGVWGLRYLSPVTPTAGTCFVAQDNHNKLNMIDIDGRYNCFLKAGLAGFEAGGYLASNIGGVAYNGSQVLFEHGTGALSQMRNVSISVIGVNRVLDETTLTGATVPFAKFGAGRWDTFIWSGVLPNGFSDGLLIDRTSIATNVSNGKFTACFFDYCARGLNFKNTTAGGSAGGINNMNFTDCWITGMDGHGIHLNGSDGSFRNVVFTDCFVLTCGKNSIRLESTKMDGVVFKNCKGWYANRLNGTNTGNERDGFVALYGGVTGTSGWRVVDCDIGKTANGFVASSVPNWQARYGFNLAPTIGNFEITGTVMTGGTADSLMSYTATKIPSGEKYVTKVIGNKTLNGAAKPAYATSGVITNPTTGVTQTNDTPFTMELFFHSGTINQVQKNSLQISAGAVSIVVEPGDTWMVSYTGGLVIVRTIYQ